jgi:hypothetical protein
MATCPIAEYRDGEQALGDARRACDLTGWKEAAYLDVLAAAYAEAGHFWEAIRWQKQALDNPTFASEHGDDARRRLDRYRENQPYREYRY